MAPEEPTHDPEGAFSFEDESFEFEDQATDLPSARSVALPVEPENVDAFGLDAAFDESPEVYGEALAAKIEYSRAQEYRRSEHLAGGGSGGSVLVFRLGDRLFGLDVLEIAEVFGADELMHVPGSPASFLGIANQRGSVLSVVDLLRVLGLEEDTVPRRRDRRPSLLVLRDSGLRASFPIDEVLGIAPMRPEAFRPDSSRDGLLGILEAEHHGATVQAELVDHDQLESALRSVTFRTQAA